jgi:hypothetical protein
MAGDNNLTEEMAWGLQELKKTAAELDARPHLRESDRIAVVAHFDPRGSRSRRYDFTPPVRPRGLSPSASRDGDLHCFERVIDTRRAGGNGGGGPDARSGEHGLSSPLAAFVREQLERLPRARRYFLVLSGHGSGAAGDFLIDSDPTTSLSIPELARILGGARESYAPEKEPRRIDIVGMDTCLMSNAEVCFEIREHADYLVASEGWVANAGWPYHRVLEACLKPGAARSADTDAASVAERVALRYREFYQDYEIAGISTDVAVCDLQAFRTDGRESLVERLQALSRACTGACDAVFVHDVVRRTPLRGGEKEVRALVRSLGDEVAGCLSEDGSERKRLSHRLADGSALAREALEKARERWQSSPEPWPELTASQRKALRELVESVCESYGLSDQHLAAQVVGDWSVFSTQLEKPRSASVALAAVKVLREFDPSILEALEILEVPKHRGRPEATQARAALQKLHQVQWILELHEAAKDLAPKPDDVDLLSALVLCRWRAQSFKGGVYVDLADLCRCLGERLRDPGARERFAGIEALVGGAVLTSLHTGAATQHARGLCVYFPCQAADYAPEYENLEFAKKTGWGRLVRAYLRATRRERRDEARDWTSAAECVVRFGHSEVDPLEADGIEARIVGVISPAPASGSPAETGAKAGTESKIRAGTESKIRAGTEAKIRGEGVLFEWGNPPDGFFRPAEEGKWHEQDAGQPGLSPSR